MWTVTIVGLRRYISPAGGETSDSTGVMCKFTNYCSSIKSGGNYITVFTSWRNSSSGSSVNFGDAIVFTVFLLLTVTMSVIILNQTRGASAFTQYRIPFLQAFSIRSCCCRSWGTGKCARSSCVTVWENNKQFKFFIEFISETYEIYLSLQRIIVCDVMLY